MLIITLLDILALDILGLDILGLDILGLDILGMIRYPTMVQSLFCREQFKFAEIFIGQLSMSGCG